MEGQHQRLANRAGSSGPSGCSLTSSAITVMVAQGAAVGMAGCADAARVGAGATAASSRTSRMVRARWDRQTGRSSFTERSQVGTASGVEVYTGAAWRLTRSVGEAYAEDRTVGLEGQMEEVL